MPKPCRVVHGDHFPGCPVCAKARTERWARAWGEPWPVEGGVAESPPPPSALPSSIEQPARVCVHRGDDLTGPERQARGLDHVRRWALCLHPEQPLGEAVCPCKGCGAKCPGYTPETGNDPG